MYKVWPMGCKKVKDDNQLENLIQDDKYAAQVKIDGVRCILHIDSSGDVRFTTRGSSVSDSTKPIEITHRLAHLAGNLIAENDSIFDGELYCAKYTSAEVSGMVSYKSSVEVDPDITLHIFDCLRFHGRDLIGQKWSERMYYLGGQAKYLAQRGFVVVPYVTGSDNKRNLYSQEIEAGREGVVFKRMDAQYTVGSDKCMKPTGVWYKAKKHDTIDVLITGSTPPEKFYRNPDTNELDTDRITKPWSNGWFGSIDFKFMETVGDNLTMIITHYGSCSGLTDQMKELLSDGCHRIKREYENRWMEVEFMEKTPDGNLRHPRFVRIREEIEK